MNVGIPPAETKHATLERLGFVSAAAAGIARDVTRASEVVKRLRQLFTKSKGTKGPVDVNAAIDEVIALTGSRVRRNGASLRTDLCNELPAVSGDRVQLQQVLVNLIVNAAESMKDVRDRPREILVRTLREGDRVRPVLVGEPARRP